ncbi:hypothetical protein DV735_g4651, partial [Chaetothyriales sp. CBS 134920]
MYSIFHAAAPIHRSAVLMDRPRGPNATTATAAATAARPRGLRCRQSSFFLHYLVAILASVHLSRAFQYVPGSGCQPVCSTGSLDADAVCLDAEFNSTAGGRRVRACVGCLLNSTAIDSATNETDVQFGLLALRFSLSSCMFGIPDERVSLSSPCQVTCTPLNSSISYNLAQEPSAASARLDYCTVGQFDDTTINNCAFCYSLIPQQFLCFCCFVSARRRRRRMAASGRISRVVEHEVRMHSPVLLSPDSKKQMLWASGGVGVGNDEPPRELSDLTNSTPVSAAPGIALGGHENDGTPLRDSFQRRY